MRMMTDNQAAGIFLIGLVAIVLILVLKEWLSFSGEKKTSGNSWRLSDYLNILKEGWRAVRENLWVFWILWVFYFLFFIENVAVSLARQGIQHLSFAHTFPFPAIYLFSLGRFFQNYLLYIRMASVYIPLSFDIDSSIFFILAVLFLIKPFKKMLTQVHNEVRMQTSVDLLKKHLPFFIAATVALLCFSIQWILWGVFPSVSIRFIRSSFFVHIYSAVAFYWFAFIQAMLTGFIFSLLKSSILKERNRRDSVFISSIGFFKPLFFFFLVFEVLDRSGIFFQMLHLHFANWNRLYNPCLIFCFLLIFLLVPYLIVYKDINLKTAFRDNFSLWKYNYWQILSFLFLVILLSLSVKYVLSLSDFLYGTYFQLVTDMAKGTIWLLFRFWIAASIMVFCIRLTGRIKGV